MTYPVIAKFQRGFRLIDGSALNNLVQAINDLTGNGTPQLGTFAGVNSTVAQTGTALGSTYNAYNKTTLSATGIASGNGRGARNELDLSGTVTGGAFLAGGQNKLIISGTMNSADSRLMAGFNQLDGSAGVFTAGQLAAVWNDMGATAPGGGWNTGSQSYVVRNTNTTASNVQAIGEDYGKANYWRQLSDNGSGWVVTGAVGGSQSTKIKVQVNGTDFYIPLNTA